MSGITDVDRGEVVATVLASVVGTVVVGGIARIGTGESGFGQVARIVGAGGATVTWVVVLVAAVAFTVAFGVVLQYATTPFVNRLFALTQRSDRLRSLLLPVVTDYAYTATALSIGVGYGLVLGIVVGLLGVPALVGAVGGVVPVPRLAPAGAVAWLCFGPVVGGTYAVLTDRS